MAEPLESDLDRQVILLVEDDFFIAADMVGCLEAAGVEVIGPAASIEEALALVETHRHRLDGAVLDINIGDKRVYPVADTLHRIGVPYVFTTGYGSAAIPPAYAGAARCEKPVNWAELIQKLSNFIRRPRPTLEDQGDIITPEWPGGSREKGADVAHIAPKDGV
jgi:CheY-like chemotaxis protein